MSAHKQLERLPACSPTAATAANSRQVGRDSTHPPSRILLIRLGGFGDVIFTIPAVDLVRTTFPDAKITFLVYKEFASLLQGFAGVDEVLSLNRARYRSFNPLPILC